MSVLHFTRKELSAAVARGVKQCVFIGSRPIICEALDHSSDENLQLFVVDEQPPPHSPATFVPTEFATEPLLGAHEKSDFDRLKATLFVWLGGAGYRTLDAAMASLSFIASLPAGSGVIFDYAVERTSLGSMTRTALDALASRICVADRMAYLIQPQAVTAMLRGFGFQNVVDLAWEELSLSGGGHLVSAVL